jgi:hypothetical protein
MVELHGDAGMVIAQRLEGNHFLCVDSKGELWMPQQQQQFFFNFTLAGSGKAVSRLSLSR